MFYSHQLLARKAALGQIWMAATLHAKIHRRKLDKLNIIKICEEILNPSVPMALRLSSILMGGVVIVYERKVKLLYDDVTRLLVEINTSWQVKSAPASAPKRKSHPRDETVMSAPHSDEDFGLTQQSVPHSNGATVTEFQRDAYISMKLDAFGDPCLNENPHEDLNQDYHQADAINITLCNDDLFEHDATPFNRFERFDIEVDDETEQIVSSAVHLVPSSLIPSPPYQEELNKSCKLQDINPQEQIQQKFDERSEAREGKMTAAFAQKRGTRRRALVMDFDQNIIPGQIFQSWLQDPSDLCSRRGRKRRRSMYQFRSLKIDILMKLPALAIMQNLIDITSRQVHYPASLLDLWVTNTQDSDDSTSAGNTQPMHPESSSLSPTGNIHFPEPVGDVMSIEKQRANAHNHEMPPDTVMEELRSGLQHITFGLKEGNGVNASTYNLMTTPANSGDEIRSIPSSGRSHDFFSHNSDANSGRSGKKRTFSASINSKNGLEPVAEEFTWHHPDPNFNLARGELFEEELTSDIFVETGATQAKKHAAASNQPLNNITESIRIHLKAHFDTPGSAKEESLEQLSFGMNRKQAAQLFFHSCVLATRGDIKLEQKVPYGEILISRGCKM